MPLNALVVSSWFQWAETAEEDYMMIEKKQLTRS